MPDVQSIRVNSLERSIEEHKGEFRDFRREDLEWKKRMEDKMDARSAASAESLVALANLAARVERVDSRIDVYKRTSQVTAALFAVIGGLLAWVLDVGSAIRDVLGR